MRHWREETNWKPLSSIVETLKREVETAFYEGRDQDADHAHDDLVSAEWRLRQAERRK